VKNGADFFNGVQVGVLTSWSWSLNIENSYENGDKFKNGLSKKGVEYF
jgi:hypothetical protein